MKKTFYSNGKLLITGEYLVLDGAKALALPTKFGQNLVIEDGENQEINWTSYDADKSIWFQETISFENIKNNSKEESKPVRNTLIEILHYGYLQNKIIIDNSTGFNVTTEISFPKFWGLGTSSTLINNIAQWLQINAFDLLNKSFGGSGYDIACAQNNTPIQFHLNDGKPIVKKINFNPAFIEIIYFVYLNQKQNSKSAIAAYYHKQNKRCEIIPIINNITTAIQQTENIDEFSSLLNQHETILSGILETQTIKEKLFPDFKGSIKSLGAWGGDFVLVISKENPTDYFKQKGYDTIIPYREMIL